MGLNENSLSAQNSAMSWSAFTQPCVAKLKSMGSTSNLYPNNNPDGWGMVWYDYSSTLISQDWRNDIPAINDPLFDDAVDALEISNPRIVMGHVRNSTNVEGIDDPHPFIRRYGGRSYSFIHNGMVNTDQIFQLITSADDTWLTAYPPTDYDGEYVDSEIYFLWILLNIHQQNGNIMQALKSALTPIRNSNNNATMNFVLSDGMDLYAYRNCGTSDTTHPLEYFYYEYQHQPNRNYYYTGVMTVPPAMLDSDFISHQMEINELVFLSSTGNIVRLPDFVSPSNYYTQKLGYHAGVNWAGFPIMSNSGEEVVSVLDYFTDSMRGGLSEVQGQQTTATWNQGPQAWINPDLVIDQYQLYKLTLATSSPSIHRETVPPGEITQAALIQPDVPVLSSVAANTEYWVSYTLFPSQNIRDAFGASWSNVKSVRAEDWFYSIPPVNPKGGISEAVELYSWITTGKNMNYGKGYIVTFKNNQSSFTWNRSYAPLAISAGKEKAEFFVWEDTPDYVVIDVIDVENPSEVKEVGVMQGDTCVGAVKTDTFPCQILAYPDYEDTTPLTFEVVYDSKAQPSSHYAYEVLDLDDFAFNDGQIIAEKDGLYQVKLGTGDSGYANNPNNKVKAISNYPNPFNPDTNISFTLSVNAEANIRIYNLKGQIVREMGVKPYKSGVNTINWDGRDNSHNPVSSGIYFIRINTGNESHTHKMLMMK